ncbi:MAG: chemotaxis response regulator protein-glutamate methylesterase [Granulosicoccus sp.]
MLSRKIKVLIVDDSLALCKFLEKIFLRDPELEVTGYALDAFEARDMIKLHNPDVITLDVEMPRMDGLTFLKNLMRLHPMPVVMLSSLTAAGAAVTLDALQVGAVDFMVKRHPGSDQELAFYEAEIVDRVKQAGKVQVLSPGATLKQKPLPDLSVFKSKLRAGKRLNAQLSKIVAIGSSTGGPEALRQLLTGFDSSGSALMFAQHMPERFMEPFAQRLNSWSSFDIRVAKNGEQIRAGRGYVAPGDMHLELVNSGGRLTCLTRKTDAVQGHRPSVDVLFNSVADGAGKAGVGVLLTGMGEDGALGLKAMRLAGALTIVQDEKSSAVWGMPGRAYELGGADGVLGLQQLSPALTSLLKQAA